MSIEYDVPNKDYHQYDGAIGQSGLKAVLKSPAFYYGQYLDPSCPPESERESAGRRFGNLVHAALFEPQHFNNRYRVGPVVTTKAAKAWKDFAAELPPGCEGITPAEYAEIQQVKRSVGSLTDIAAALRVGHGEVSAYWRDEESDAECKCRPDWVHPVGDDAVILLDGKTYASADPAEFTRQVAKMDYHMQAAWYSDGYAKASGKKVLGFIFLVIEDTYPHLVSAMQLDEESLEAGRRKYRGALNTYGTCIRTGEWPGHGNAISLITLPIWAKEAP